MSKQQNAVFFSLYVKEQYNSQNQLHFNKLR